MFSATRAAAEGRILARLGQRAAVGAHFVGRLAVDVGVAGRDQVFGERAIQSK
jgi:hypothetical protein